MQSTGFLCFRALAAKIHPQLPLSPRESQQLLSLLTTSFRRHLDREHPSSLFRDSGHRSSGHSAASPKSAGKIDHSSQFAAAQHLESLLTSPLFVKKPRRHSVSSTGGAHDAPNITEAQRIISNPLRWFEEHVASGTATIDTARICLATLRKNILSSPMLSVKQGMKETSAGSRVFTWLRSSGLSSSLEFRGDGRLIRLLAQFLVSEDKQDLLWRWIHANPRKQAEDTGSSVDEIYRFQACVLKSMVEAQLSQQDSIDAALGIVLKPVLWGKSASRVFCRELTPAARYIVNFVASGSPFAISDPHIYDAFLENAHRWTKYPEIDRALLSLHHRNHLDAQIGLDYLKNKAAFPAALQNLPSKYRRLHIQLCLSLAKHLLAQEQFSDASWVLGFARDTFPQELGLLPETITVKGRTPNGQQNELANLRLLEGLSFG